MKTYKEFIEILKEGLITTHNINLYYGVIKRKLDNFKISHDLKIINKLSFDLTLKTNKKDIIEIINHLCFMLGYYPSAYYIQLNNNMENNYKNIDDIIFNKFIKNIKIIYEAAYDDGLYKNDIICPEKLYHLTPSKNWDSILKKGIYPKSKKRLSDHPERIYLFDNLDDYYILLKNLKISDSINGNNFKYDLIEIDSSNDKFILHIDPNYPDGYFTYDTINPNLIKKIKSEI